MTPFPAGLLAGRTILVTGGTRGIGLQVCAQLAEAGGRVILNGRSAERGDAALASLRSSQPDGQFTFIAGDISSHAGCVAIYAEIDRQFDGLQGLVNCADMIVEGARGRFAEVDPEALAPAFQASVIPLMHVVQQALPRLYAAKGASIVTFASDSGKVAGAWQTMVGATKASIMMFTRALAMEVANKGVSVNCVSPSYVKGTDIYDTIAAGSGGERVARAEARAGLGLPDAGDVARLAVFLSSPWAAHLTGQVISINGGITAA